MVRLAQLKAAHGTGHGARPALGADTIVSVDGRILGKPRDAEDGMDMLRLLSGRAHRVLSGVALAWDGQIRTALSASTVRFRVLTLDEITNYWASSEPHDKAGAYAVQGLAARFIERL